MSFPIIATNILSCLLFPLHTYAVTQGKIFEILKACEGNKNLKNNAGIMSKEEANAEFGVWILPHRQTIHLCAELISRVIKPILLISVIEMICLALSLLDVIPDLYKIAVLFILFGCLLIQCVICLVYVFKLNNACKKLIAEFPAEDGQNTASN